MSSIYLFPGLGADFRVFGRLDFSNFEPIVIQWELPEKGETIEQYALRILQQIQHPKPILVGLSFGGILAVEVAKLIDYEQLILISTAKTRWELPWYYRWLGKTSLYRLLPDCLLKSANPLSYWLFGIKSNEDRKFFKAILKDSDALFMRRAIHLLLHWKNTKVPPHYLHLHGTADRLLPFRYIKHAVKINGAGHFMVWDRANEVQTLMKLHV